MQQTRILMGMPISVEIVDHWVTPAALEQVFGYFAYVDATFSTYQQHSQISRINAGELSAAQANFDVQAIFALAEQTRQATHGYFDIQHNGHCDPSGIVKGWSIYQAALLLWRAGFRHFYIDAGGDIQTSGRNRHGQPWRIGIRNPFNSSEIVKALVVSNGGVATSGTYVRGAHIYNPLDPTQPLNQLASLTVIGPNIYEADRLATAAFAMGQAGIHFIEHWPGCEGYMIDAVGQATFTHGFARYIAHE